ncbi:MAG: glycoside hydrolase family 97 N-terminal domain-containing protein [Phycisphaerae bacterium]|nr:glycoside hydrolase family 97 N-terminal domain-containing protein [Phycisphaerae bacterium]
MSPCGIIIALTTGIGAAAGAELRSPDGNVVLHVQVADFEGAKACLTYRVAYKGKPIVCDSRLGLDVNDAAFAAGLEITRQSTGDHDETWTPVCGERSRVRDRYRRLAVELKETWPPHRLLSVTFRAYDEGVALCYTIPKQKGLQRVRIARENTEFRFTADHAAWAVYSAQGKYAKVPLSKIKPGCERPLTIRVDDDTFVALAEARLVDYARTKLAPLEGKPHALVSQLSSDVSADLPVTTPWRVIMVADGPGALLQNNDIIRNLNDPCAIKDTSWIKPGKVIREVTLSTVGGKACVDLAARHNLQYVEYDAGWYGHEYDDASDAATVTLDPKRSKGPLDLAEVIRYAESKGVGIILYVNRRALERQLDQVLPLYRKWGVKGVKYGFVQVGSQRWTAWLHEAVRKAADCRLMVDIHDEYRPTGYSRTYPNLMTQEGIAGDETTPSNELTLTILFTRMLAGAGDNTICYYNKRVDQVATHAYQLAKAVCIYSPWQFLYWYDRPPGSRPGDEKGKPGPGVIGDEPELEFFDHVPTVWDDTRVLHARIGELAVIARRSGESWFVGCMNARETRTFDVALSFLDKGRPYVAHVYSDDKTVQTRTHVKIERFLVRSDTVLKAAVWAQGGLAVRIVPAEPGDRFPVYK